MGERGLRLHAGGSGWWAKPYAVRGTDGGRHTDRHPTAMLTARLAPNHMPRYLTTCLLTTAIVCGAAPAAADVGVRFIEGAPKDRFEITNEGACALVATEIVIDLRGSAAGLVFDVTDTGAGVEVFQPFELVEGADALASTPRVADGDRQVMLSVRRLAPAGRIAFTIDVDDTVGPRGITVSDAEIEGALVRVSAAGSNGSGRFSRQGEARVKTPACP